MIFFLTTIIPSSDVESELRKQKNDLLKKRVLHPLPFPLIPVSITKNLPIRTTRKMISATFPEIITLSAPYFYENKLIADINEEISFNVDEELDQISPIFSNRLIYGMGNESAPELDYLPLPPLKAFRNYSLATYKIHSSIPDNWIRGFSWEKLQEVKKGK